VFGAAILVPRASWAAEPGVRPGATGGTRCDGAEAAQLLGTPAHDWQTACWRLDDGRQILAAVPLTPLTPAKVVVPAKPAKPVKKDQPRDSAAGPLVVRLALAKDGAVVWRGELRPDAKSMPELREVLEKSDEWLVAIEDVALGRERAVRVGVVGHWGDETMSVREIALLYRLPENGGPMRLLWSGLGNTRESRLDYCLIEGIATFQLVDDKTLERQMRVTATINHDNTHLPRARARALEKKCVAESPAPQRFPSAP
jgi:hypothetical protein